MEDKFVFNHNAMLAVQKSIETLLSTIYDGEDTINKSDMIRELVGLEQSVLDLRESFTKDFCEDEELTSMICGNIQNKKDSLDNTIIKK